MKNSILYDLYHGEIYPEEAINPTDSNYRLLERNIGKKREDLKKKLDKQDCDRLEELGELYRESVSINSYANFSYGFKLGALLMCEIFVGDDKKDL